MVTEFRLKDLMNERGVTYRQVSAAADVSTNTLSKMAQNKLKMVGIGVIDRLCDYFDCEPGDLIIRIRNGKDNAPPPASA